MQASKPLVFVIMPVYNTGKYLEESVLSVVDQTYDNLEILLVDDGSSDNSPQICDKLSEKYDNVKVIHKKNGGLSDARNCGLDIAGGKYILFLDSDDTIDRDTISSMVEIAENEESDVVFPDRYYKHFEETNENKLCYLFDDSMLYDGIPLNFATDFMIAKGCAWRATSVLYKKDVVKNNDCLFPVGYTSEDVVFNLQVLSYAKKYSVIHKPTLNYLKRKGSITTSFNKNYFDCILYIDKQAISFLELNNIKTDSNQAKVDSLLIKNVIVYFFSVYDKNTNLSKTEKKELVESILNNDRVKNSMNVKMVVPFFDRKFLGNLIVLIHMFFKLRCKAIAIALIKLVNILR